MKRAGFTLIELLVVVLMLGILAAFGVPQYLRSLENSKALDAASMATMIATTNRMYAIDHTSTYASGKLSTACGSDTSCQQLGATNPCSLVDCKYLAAQDFDNASYWAYADDGAGTKCSALGFGAGKWASCVVRQKCSGGGVAGVCANSPPYTNWGYAVDITGKIGYANTCNTGSPACPTPVE